MNRFFRPLRAAAIAAPVLSAGAAMAAPVNLLANGSFEDVGMAAGVQSLAANSWNTYASLPGWSSSNGIEVRHNVSGAAQDGLHFIELDTNVNSGAWQMVSTVAGDWYDLSFWYAARPGTGGMPAGTNQIGAYWNDTLLGLLDQSSSSQHQWVQYAFTVMGTGLDELEFRALGRSDSYGGSLDNVRLVNAVPEPASLLLALGAVALVAARRRSPRR
jgi:hypothetical protein